MLEIRRIYSEYLEKVAHLVASTPLITDEISSLAKEVDDTELLIPVIGSYSAGKSSLLNAFLGEDVLSVAIAPETELATELRFSTDPHLLAIREDGTSERMDVSSLADSKSLANEFAYLRLYLNNSNLKALASLVLVDMPGFGSTLANHNKAIAHYLPRGAHFLVATSVEEGNITQSLMRQLEDLQTYERAFSFLLTKTNLRSEDQVRDVADLIGRQVNLVFSHQRPVVPVGTDGAERLIQILADVHPERIFKDLFERRMKDLTHTLINQINLALASLEKDQAENARAMADLADGIRRIEHRRDLVLADVQEHQLSRTVERCLSEAGRDLESAQTELVNAALSSNTDAFSRTVSEIVRSALSRTIKREMGSISDSLVTDFSDALADLGGAAGVSGNDDNWLSQMSERIALALQKTGQTIDGWSNSLADHTSREREKLKEKGGHKEGQPLPKVSYQSLATILAVTTNVVNPLVELAIVFLPTILDFFNEGRQKDRIRQQVLTEIIPSVKQQLRRQLPTLLQEQLQGIVDSIAGEFQREISQQEQLIDQFVADRHDDEQDKETQMVRLNRVREELLHLADHALYGKVAA